MSESKKRVHVQFFQSIEAYERGEAPLGEYDFDPNNPLERKTMGMRCADSYQYGGMVMSWVNADEA